MLALVGWQTGAMLGVLLASFSVLLWFAFIFATPYGAVAGIALSLSVIWGFTRDPANLEIRE